MSETTPPLEHLKSLETLCRLNEQALSFIREENTERLGREAIATAQLENTLSEIFRKIDEVKSDMGNFRNEIDERVEKCSEKMEKRIEDTYATKVEVETGFNAMTRTLTTRITLVGAAITVVILVAKYLFSAGVIT